MALVSFSGTSRRLAWVSCSSTALRRLFLVGSDSAISQQRNAESRAALEQGGLRAGSTKLLLHIEHGRRPLLKPVRVGLREQGCVAGAVCFTCNKGNAIKIANMGRHASDISQGSDGSSADSQTALRGRTDFFRLCYSFWILSSERIRCIYSAAPLTLTCEV